MALNIDTFSNYSGGNVFYKALCHPTTAHKMNTLLRELKKTPLAIYDPRGVLAAFNEFYPLQNLTITNVYVQNIEHIGKTFSFTPRVSEPLTDLNKTSAHTLLVLGFDCAPLLPAITPSLPKGMKVYSLDDVKVDALAKKEGPYLTPLNFATNFVFFRDQDGCHTRLVTANYWHLYGGKNITLACTLFGEEGNILATWDQSSGESAQSIVIDSQEIRKKFKLDPFVGQIFIHVLGAKGHDILKYALDTYGDEDTHLSCTHDANSWPAETYGGLPAPQENEEVYFWIQNSHPVPIPAKTMGLNIMGEEAVSWLDKEIPPFATYPLSVADLLPKARWPQQIEIQAGKYVVRPRYEVVCKKTNRQRIAHVNVQRSDLKPTIKISELKPYVGKAYILPMPILPQSEFQSLALPTPMASCQQKLPLKVFIYDASGQKMAEESLGVLNRNHTTLVDAKKWSLPSGYGHLEIAYDPEVDMPVDGWLHALARYQRKDQVAETSFGAHIFNTPLVYKDEPQNYAGNPPGLRTRLFLRIADGQHDSGCFLIYPSSTTWHPTSDTAFILHDKDGKEVATNSIKIPCSGSHFFSYHQAFPEEVREKAKGGYIIVRDFTCRLFGYHGTFGTHAFSFDHMFGF
jgi:hypothetical protein